MIDKLIRYARQVHGLQRINLSLARAAATSGLRRLDPTDPSSWEFSGFSQNGEDGILDELTRWILHPHRDFVEIGASDGLENNTTWLALGRRFGGLWIEADPAASESCQHLLGRLNYGVETRCMFVTRESVGELVHALPRPDPDVFSIDIDGNDYHVVEAIFAARIRPRIWVVEYNSAFGPERSVTIPYRADFHVARRLNENLYYGCSISAWRRLFSRAGYRFVTVESNGINAFFIDPGVFPAAFVEELRGAAYRPNTSHTREYGVDWRRQLERLEARELVEVE
jgi:hypothetical protein